VTNDKAGWALGLGLGSIIGACCSGLLGLVGVAAIVIGVQARREIAASNGTQTGGGIAVAGIVTGVLGVVLTLVMTLVFVGLLVGLSNPNST
jgi:hypothetical protein